MVAAAEVDPLHLRDELAELRFEGRNRALQYVGALLAHRMEVEPLESLEVGRRFDLGAEGAEARAGGAGVVEFDVDLGVLRVDAEAEGELAAGR